MFARTVQFVSATHLAELMERQATNLRSGDSGGCYSCNGVGYMETSIWARLANIFSPASRRSQHLYNLRIAERWKEKLSGGRARKIVENEKYRLACRQPPKSND